MLLLLHVVDGLLVVARGQLVGLMPHVQGRGGVRPLGGTRQGDRGGGQTVCGRGDSGRGGKVRVPTAIHYHLAAGRGGGRIGEHPEMLQVLLLEQMLLQLLWLRLELLLWGDTHFDVLVSSSPDGAAVVVPDDSVDVEAA